jgi:hypothetical protein
MLAPNKPKYIKILFGAVVNKSLLLPCCTSFIACGQVEPAVDCVELLYFSTKAQSKYAAPTFAEDSSHHGIGFFYIFHELWNVLGGRLVWNEVIQFNYHTIRPRQKKEATLGET